MRRFSEDCRCYNSILTDGVHNRGHFSPQESSLCVSYERILEKETQAVGRCDLNHIAGKHVVGSSLPVNLYLHVFLLNTPISEAKHSYTGPSDEGEAGGQRVMGPRFFLSGPSGPPASSLLI